MIRLNYFVDGLEFVMEFSERDIALDAYWRISGQADLVRVIDDHGVIILSACSRTLFDPRPVTIH
jgi:hypothetical protein